MKLLDFDAIDLEQPKSNLLEVDVVKNLEKPRVSVGANEPEIKTTFEKVKMLRITTNLNEIVVSDGRNEQPKNHSEKIGGFFQFLVKDK